MMCLNLKCSMFAFENQFVQQMETLCLFSFCKNIQQTVLADERN